MRQPYWVDAEWIGTGENAGLGGIQGQVVAACQDRGTGGRKVSVSKMRNKSRWEDLERRNSLPDVLFEHGADVPR